MITASAVRRMILDQAHRAHQGHIGSALAVADILALLYDSVIQEGDIFVMSKGHAALALYAAMHLTGLLPEIDRYCEDGSLLGVHPDHRVPGIDFSTGSLGHGLSWAAGVALADRLAQRSDLSAARREAVMNRRIFVLMSDAELNEGSVWEAVMFAGQRRLSNLTAIIDVDRQQALGYTENILDLEPLEQKFRAFHWQPFVAHGHDAWSMKFYFDHMPFNDWPQALICHTTFGKGVRFMEGQVPWHYLPLTDAQYRQAIAELD